jgi:hypothetical protein
MPAAEMLATLASAQKDVAEVVESLALKHAALAESLEQLTAPVFGLVINDQADR